MTKNINYSLSSILFLLSIYVILLSMNKLISTNISFITYILASVIILFNILYISTRYSYIEKKILIIYIFSIFVIIFNILIHKMGLIDIIKIIGSQLFLFVGMLSYNKFNLKKNRKIVYFSILIILPILILLLENLSLISHESELSSIFINKNNAVLYFISLIPLLYYFNFSKIVLISYSLVSIILFKTLGALVAFLLATIYIYKKFNLKTFLYMIIILIIIYITFIWLKDLNLSAINRIEKSVNTMQILFTKYNLKELANLEFGRAVSLTGSTDLSFLFRIKHWSEIINYYIETNCLNQIIGIGIGNIPNITSMQLVAHNDFLKLFTEFGPIYFISYLMLMLHILKNIVKKYKFLSISFLTIFIYFGTENLMNNFLAMSFFYYFLGIYYTKSKEQNEDIND